MDDSVARILVVDDDLFTAELTGLFLESTGYEVVTAEGGVEAMEKMADDPSIRMVVSDMNMPFINGIQLFEELRRQGFIQPFLLLTGDDAGPIRIAHPDINKVMTKDEDLQETLPEIVRRLLDKQGQQL